VGSSSGGAGAQATEGVKTQKLSKPPLVARGGGPLAVVGIKTS